MIDTCESDHAVVDSGAAPLTSTRPHAVEAQKDDPSMITLSVPSRVRLTRLGARFRMTGGSYAKATLTSDGMI
jgi:hypothetical protein